MAYKSAAVWVASLITDEQSAQKFAGAVAETMAAAASAVSLVDAGHGRWRVEIHCHDPPDKGALRTLAVAAAGPAAGRALRFARLAPRDWVGESLAGLKPVAAGRFVVHGAHDRLRVPVNRIGIEIEAALAFGTGHHATTRGCLLALDRLYRLAGNGHPPARILDLGAGSGVLAIAAARAFRRRVLATDIDAVAVHAARDNARRNHAGPLIEVVRANGLQAPAIRAGALFDLVFANILLEPLQRLAAPLAKIIAPGGRVVLSGLLSGQTNAAIAAYRGLSPSLGLALERRIAFDGWTTLVLKRAAAC